VVTAELRQLVTAGQPVPLGLAFPPTRRNSTGLPSRWSASRAPCCCCPPAQLP
jgi:hypothetical protein